MTREAGSKDPLHGITLEKILKELVDYYGWEQLAVWIRIDCFANEPSMSSSLRFLRRTPWARKKVENLYRERPGGGVIFKKVDHQSQEAPYSEQIVKAEQEIPVVAQNPVVARPPGSINEIPILLRVQVKMVPRMDKPAVQAALINKIENYFESIKLAGSVVMVSHVVAAINGVDGVEKLETMNFFRQDEGARSPHPRDLKMGRLEIPVMGKFSILLR